jgi:hypothetical protein
MTQEEYIAKLRAAHACAVAGEIDAAAAILRPLCESALEAQGGDSDDIDISNIKAVGEP